METLYPSSLFSDPTNTTSTIPSWWMIPDSNSSINMSKMIWTKEENKNFEKALAIYDERDPERWMKIAAMTRKSIFEVMQQYKELEDDVSDIEAGLVPVPGYNSHQLLKPSSSSSTFTLEWVGNGTFNDEDDDLFRRRLCRPPEHERKKGIPWTEDEHRRFLLGLEKHGKGDWRNISRNFVKSKTPTQVASHAQKFFLRHNSGGKDKRRPSIHDITSPNFTDSTTLNIPLNNMPLKPTSIASVLQHQSASMHKATLTPQILLDWSRTNQPKDEAVMTFNATRSLPPTDHQSELTAIHAFKLQQGPQNNLYNNFHHPAAGTYLRSFNNLGSQFKASTYKVQG